MLIFEFCGLFVDLCVFSKPFIITVIFRPVSNFTDTLVVKLGLKLSQLIDVDLKNQVQGGQVDIDVVASSNLFLTTKIET